jgi:hypothetical protein
MTHNEAPHSVVLLRMSDQLVAETSIYTAYNTHRTKNVHATGVIFFCYKDV